MGYEHYALKAACGHCGREVAWNAGTIGKFPSAWTCKCQSVNTLRLPEPWPNVPKYLYIGADKLQRLKVSAVPPDSSTPDWAQPYSIRSFIAQASRRLGGCYFTCSSNGSVLGEQVFRDTCTIWEPDADQGEDTDCHLVPGWSTGQATCPLWERVAALCQTDHEQRFLHHYLRFVKDRQFPMLIPQPRIGIAERRRPDFVLFVPLQHWNYQWLAVELDGAHGNDQQDRDAARDTELLAHGYEVFSVRPAEKGYLEEVRRLVERIEEKMHLASENVWHVATAAKVVRYTTPDELPF
jgi:hypothetical protein